MDMGKYIDKSLLNPLMQEMQNQHQFDSPRVKYEGTNPFRRNFMEVKSLQRIFQFGQI